MNVKCGSIEGVWDTPGIAGFYGIPFAQPPTGHLRWMPPRDPDCWGKNVTFMAIKPAPACPQLNLGSQDNMSEDCLYLNVFSTLPSKPVPVLVWIYGGGSVDGSAESYGPVQNMVRDLEGEVVLVAFNYRLNSFGYFALRELSAIDPRGVSGNYGILDCQKALQWVQQNIAMFGGDPTRVGVFGQSSGGTQVLGLLASPGSRGLFRAAISLSGSPNMTMPLHVMENQGLQFVRAAGCEGASDVLKCMYALDMTALRKATPQHWAYEGDFLADTVYPVDVPYPGLVIVDGVTITMPLPQALHAGLVDVPTIISSMQTEMDGSFNESMAWNQEAFDRFCGQQFRHWPAEVGPGIAALYDPMAQESAGFAFYNLQSDVCVTCGNAAIAVQAGFGFRSPVYLMLNTHWPSHPIYGSSTSAVPKHFPYHTWDTTCAFDTWAGHKQAGGGPYVPLQADLDYGANLRQLWLQLTRDGVLPSNCKTVNDVGGFPANYNTVLLSNTVVTALNYKTHMCDQLYTYGLDEKFWWVN